MFVVSSQDPEQGYRAHQKSNKSILRYVVSIEGNVNEDVHNEFIPGDRKVSSGQYNCAHKDERIDGHPKYTTST